MGCDKQRLVLALYPAGDVFRRWVDCGRWVCPVCGRKRLLALARDLIEVAPVSVGYGAFGAKLGGHNGAVRRALSRIGGASLRLSLGGGGLVIVTDVALTGRGWKVDKVGLKDAVIALAGLDLADPPRRTDWVAWRPAREEKERRPVLFKATFLSVEECDSVLAEVGYRLRDGAVVDPEGTAERLRIALGTDLGAWERRSSSGRKSPGQT